MKSAIKKGIAVSLSAAAVLGATATTAFATDATATEDTVEKFTMIEKISNPYSGEREVDGLVEGGDRETSYAWCMAARGDYVYIGTNKNIVGDVANSLVSSLVAKGMDEDTVWAMIDVITNGEVPRPTTEEGGYILRCNQKTGEITKIYTAPKSVSFRMAMEFNGNVYFGSYSTVAGFAGPDAEGLSNDIIRIDENDNVEKVFSSYDGTSMRAACIHEDALYFGGVDASEVLEEGDEACKKLAILRKDDEDDSVWHRVADYKDFGEYASNPAVSNAASSPIWDMCSYKGYIYATIPNGRGFVMFKGHPAAEGETANEYGWYWEEVVGYYNGINNIGLSDDPAGNDESERGLVSLVATPFVFNDELYVMDFDHTIGSITQALTGVVKMIAGEDVKASDYLRPVYTSLQHPQSLYRYNDETGAFEEVEEFNEFMEGNCNEYLWRSAVYDGELYISTMDSSTIYNYITRLTNGSFFEMTPQEIKDQIKYIKVFLEKLGYLDGSNEKVQEVKALMEQLKAMLEEIQDMDVDTEEVQAFIDQYSGIIDQIKEYINNSNSDIEYLTETVEDDVISDSEMEEITDAFEGWEEKAEEIYNNIDWEGLEMYAYISEMVRNDTWGFDLIKTADGENFELVTDDGFGDKYNYGGRSMVATETGLYIGTANPFYGAQLWRITNYNEVEEESTEESSNESSEESNVESSTESTDTSKDESSNETSKETSADTKSPSTGDNTSPVLASAVMALAAVSVIVLSISSKKKKTNVK